MMSEESVRLRSSYPSTERRESKRHRSSHRHHHLDNSSSRRYVGGSDSGDGGSQLSDGGEGRGTKSSDSGLGNDRDRGNEEHKAGRHHMSSVSDSDVSATARHVHTTIQQSLSVDGGAVTEPKLNHLNKDEAIGRRLLIVSSKIKNACVMQSAILPNIIFLQYKYENSTLDSCLCKQSLNS